MKILRRNHLRNAIATFLLVNISAVCVPQQTHAQINPDATLPNPSVVVDANPLFTITGGTTANSNLFHSFSQFSLPTGTEAFFNNSALIQNILVRVTGNSISSVDGVISANGTANLFLINPSGILFGQNASLNIGGSFLATTANSIRFLDGSEFRANANTQTTSPLLLVSAPVGLQFNGLTNGAIVAAQSQLNVLTGRTLALVGGDITLQGAQLIASKGRIELGSIEGNGFVAIANGWRLNYDNAPNLGNIQLENAFVEVSGIDGAGSIQIQGRQATLNNGSFIRSSSLGSGDGGDIFIVATELFAARELDSTGTFGSRVEAAVFGGDVKGSNITLTAKRVELTNGGTIITGTFGAGKAGDIRINASDILVSGDSQPQISRIMSQTFDLNATGNSGNIIINTNNLLLSENGEVRSDTNGIGNAGIVEITAKNINLINTRNQEPELTNILTTVITSGVFDGARGNGGTLKINTDNLQMTGDTFLTASTLGIGNAGNIDINAKSIFLDSSNSPFDRALIFNGSFQDATGNGGEVKITTDILVLKDGGQISADTQGISGNAGNLLINAKFIDIFGRNSIFRSGLFANAIVGTGNGGNIEVNSDRLILRDRGIISTSNFPDQQIGADPNFSGKGSVGNITINSPSILLDQGNINIDSLNGSRGNINLNSSLILLRNGSKISTNALGNATGGNIRINTDFLVGVPLENSDITANSLNNFGGKVDITAKGVIGFQTVNRLTPLSDITATSALGTQFNGLVAILTLDTDLSRGLVKLPDTLTDGNKQIVAACDRLRGNEFIITGRGGVPSDASKVISSQAIWRDLRLSEIPSTQSNSTSQAETNLVTTQSTRPVAIQPIPQIEAQGWEKDGNGRLKLLAYATSPSDPVWRLPVICPAKK